MNKRIQQTHFAVAIATVLSIAGCSHHKGVLNVDACADIPCGAIPEPPGSKICAWETIQATQAAADQSVLYISDFVGTTTQLSPAATQRIGRLVQAGAAENLPWVIESSDDSDLDATRANALVEALAELGVAPIDVTIGTPAALGLRGPQAERIAGNAGRNRNSISNSRARTGGRNGGFGFGGFGRGF